MTAKPWMPLYIGDFIADTTHLGATETGIYIRLLMHCWQHGTIPCDDRKLALISHCDSRLWHQYGKTVLQFFDAVGASTMHNKRVTSERARAEKISSKRKGAAQQMLSKRRANAEQVLTQSQSHSHIGGGERAADPEARKLETPAASSVSPGAFDLAASIVKLCGHDENFIPPGWAGAPLTVQGWLNGGWTAEQIGAACRDIMAGKRDGPPATIAYFEKGIARFVARLAQPLPQDDSKTETGHGRKPTPHQQRLAEHRAAIEQRRRDCTTGRGDGGQHAAT